MKSVIAWWLSEHLIHRKTAGMEQVSIGIEESVSRPGLFSPVFLNSLTEGSKRREYGGVVWIIGS